MFLPGDLALKYLLSNQSNPRTLGLDLLFLGWVMTCVVVVAVEWLYLFLSRAWVMGRLGS